MKQKGWIKIVLISGSFAFLAACNSAHKHNQGMMNTAAIDNTNSAYSEPAKVLAARSSGLGNGARFNEPLNSIPKDRILAKRTYYFDYDSNIIHQTDKPAISANADYLVSHNKAKVLLEGHTDPRGSREYNIGLGERRAKSVAEVLATKGVNPHQINLVSYGAEKLAAPGRNEADYQKDRRVVLVYVKR